MNTDQLTKLIADCQAKLDEGTPGEWEYTGGKYQCIAGPHKTTIAEMVSADTGKAEMEANAHLIAALHNGFRKQLEVALELMTVAQAWVQNADDIERQYGHITSGSKDQRLRARIQREAIRAMLTPIADFLGVEYDK